MSLAKNYGDIEFGEINNKAVNQYTHSFESYFNYNGKQAKFDFMKEFGSFKFGEINNLLLTDLELALNRFFYGI